METSPRDTIGMMPPRPAESLTPSEPAIYPESGHQQDGTLQSPLDKVKATGEKAYQGFEEKITDYRDQHPMTPESSKKTKMIAVGTIAAGAIGMIVKKRQSAKSSPQNVLGSITDKTKEFVRSR